MNSKSFLLLLSVVFALDLGMAQSLTKWHPFLQLHVLNIGQGDSVLIVTPEQHHILVDGGPGNAVLSELSAVLPYAFSEIDLMVLTHPDLDHVEGLVHVLDRYNVKAVLVSAPDHDTLVYTTFLEKLRGKTVYFAEDDTDFRLGSTTLDVLYPFEPMTGKHLSILNNASPVIKVEQGGHSILLSGDAEKEVEDQVLGLNLKADLFKAGHHGSRTSNSEAFLKAIDPEWVLISAGVDNKFGHPHVEVLERMQNLGIQTLCTCEVGRISVIFAPYLWTRSILAPRLRSFSSMRS